MSRAWLYLSERDAGRMRGWSLRRVRAQRLGFCLWLTNVDLNKRVWLQRDKVRHLHGHVALQMRNLHIVTLLGCTSLRSERTVFANININTQQTKIKTNEPSGYLQMLSGMATLILAQKLVASAAGQDCSWQKCKGFYILSLLWPGFYKIFLSL